MTMNANGSDAAPVVRWGIYHQDREYAREMGDPCLGIVAAGSKLEAEAEARRQGISGPTGLWAHPLASGSA